MLNALLFGEFKSKVSLLPSLYRGDLCTIGPHVRNEAYLVQYSMLLKATRHNPSSVQLIYNHVTTVLLLLSQSHRGGGEKRRCRPRAPFSLGWSCFVSHGDASSFMKPSSVLPSQQHAYVIARADFTRCSSASRNYFQSLAFCLCAISAMSILAAMPTSGSGRLVRPSWTTRSGRGGCSCRSLSGRSDAGELCSWYTATRAAVRACLPFSWTAVCQAALSCNFNAW